MAKKNLLFLVWEGSEGALQLRWQKADVEC